MTDSLTTLTQALATALTVPAGLTGYATWPDDFGAVVPAVAVVPKTLVYDTDSGSTYPGRLFSVALVLFAARASSGMAQGIETLYGYLDDQAAGSIKALIDADPTLGGTCDYCMFKGWEDIRLDYVLTPNGPQYIGALGSIDIAA